ncbi:alpha/beta hydrolase [Streptomyces sp. NPDC058739]|uniref:alpha/beta hydrolase n=1 Tax=Streptomyces sp. NPDC058739 TaxID=3346618 RepID=UPI0036895BC5
MRRFLRWAAVGATTALLLTGCTGGATDNGRESGDDDGRNGTRTGGLAPPSGPVLPSSLTAQEPDWGECQETPDSPAPGGDWRCATLKVPLDWAQPEGKTIGLSLIRSEARGDDRIGSLVFNFGGPGGSGVSAMPSYAAVVSSLRDRYDLVSFDPRGVGGSEGIRCRDDKAVQAAEAVDITPDTPAEERAFLADAAGFGQDCARRTGELMAHVSTTDTARDMDLMRHVLGDDELHYFGISYGTELGGVYAHLFPENVGRMVLDAVVDPTADAVGHAENQTLGFQRALNDYLKSTGEDPERGTARIAALLERLDSDPLPATSGRELTQSMAVIGIVLPLYSKDSWPSLAGALEAAESGEGSELLALADIYNERDASGHYGTTTHAQRVISCLDDRQRPTPDEARKSLPRFERLSPVFGPFLGWDTAGWCHEWPVDGLHDTPEVSAPGAPPILTIGNTGDPATPYEGARRMADELGEDVGVVLTWKGEGHGAYGSGSDCVDSTVDTYLLEGTPPRDGKVCS